MSTPEVLDGIKARLAGITPGPWDRPLNTRYRASVTAQMPKGDPTSRRAGNVDHEGNPERVAIVSCPIWSTGKFFRKQSGKDLDFIAAAPTDVARLTAAVDAVLAEADRFERLGNKHHANAVRTAIENALKEQS